MASANDFTLRPDSSAVDVEKWSSQDSVDTPAPGLVSRLELIWAHSAQMLMTALWIVKGVDVVRQVDECQFAGLVDVLLDPFLL